MIFNMTEKSEAEKARKYFFQLFRAGAKIELKRVQITRSSQQNRALHLLFEIAAKELNGMGIPFTYSGLKGMEMETPFSGLIFKEFTWKPIQKTMFGTESTTKLTTQQIDQIFTVLNKFFAERGVELVFPSEFNKYIEKIEREGLI